MPKTTPNASQLVEQTILDHMQTQVWYLTDTSHYGAVNQAHADFLGRSKAEIEHRDIYSFLPREEADICVQGNVEVFAGSTPLQTREWVRSATNGARLLSVHKIPVCGDDGEVQYVVCTADDITEQQRLNELKTEFLSTAAHELRSPTTSILGFTELLLQRKYLPEEKKDRYLALILSEAQNMSQIVQNYLDISRIESGQDIALNQENVDISSVIRDFLEQFRNRSAHTVEVPRLDSCALSIDRGKIVQVLDNLLMNAAKYTPQERPVRLQGLIQSGWYVLLVQDEGPGMSEHEVANIFNKFFRGSQAESAAKGLGLGMYVVRHLVHKHQGQITVDSVPGRGTTVRIALPLNQPQATSHGDDHV